MTFIRRLMEIKERQLVLEEARQLRLADMNLQLHDILIVLKKEKYVYWEKDNTKVAIDVRRKDGKRNKYR